MSENRSLVDFPALRSAPAHVVRGLREVDPAAELLYVGRGRWVLGTVRPDRELRERAGRTLERARRVLEIVRAKHGDFLLKFDPRTIEAVNAAVLELQGFRPVASYRIQGEPDSRIVEDFRRRDWMWRNLSDQETDALLTGHLDERLAEARAELRDEARARDAWRYMFTRSHSVTRWDDPTRRSTASGRTLVRVVS